MLLIRIKQVHETDDNWDFFLGDYNNNGQLDLYAIGKKCTGSKSTEVHILSGSNNFRENIINPELWKNLENMEKFGKNGKIWKYFGKNRKKK